MNDVLLELDEVYPQPFEGFTNVVQAADYALADAMWSYACDEQDVSDVNRLCAA